MAKDTIKEALLGSPNVPDVETSTRMGMTILGLVFAGTSTQHRTAMTGFLGHTLELDRVHVEGVEADLFGLPMDSSTSWLSGFFNPGAT